MKKLLVLLLAITTSTTFCTVRWDNQRRVYYSENAPSNVNQDEYDELVYGIELRYPQGVLSLSVHQLAVIFATLKMRGTPAALQVIRDTEEVIQAYKKDMKHLQCL